MIRRILAIASVELKIALRNRWIAIAVAMMTLFAVALTFAGAGPTGAIGVDLLTVSVASMTTLSIYLTPLLALLMTFDAIAGEVERGSLGLVLTYPVTRGELLAGKFLAHLSALGGAICIGFGAAGLIAAALGGAGPDSFMALARLMFSSSLLGAAFLALGYALSCLAGAAAGAAGLGAALWLVVVVLYDFGLLGALVYDEDGAFARTLFPWLLTLNPADALRLWNLGGSEHVALVSGMLGAADALPGWAAPASLLVWPVVALGLARAAFGRVQA